MLGDSLEFVADGEALVVILHGVLDVEVDGERPGCAPAVAPACSTAVATPCTCRRVRRSRSRSWTAVGSAAIVAIAIGAVRRRSRRRDARIITPADQRVAEVGRRQLGAAGAHHPRVPSTRPVGFIVGETINPPGNWSSYPPHKHDEHRPPHEVQLEEVYYFKFDPPGGFGVQLRYDEQGRRRAVSSCATATLPSSSRAITRSWPRRDIRCTTCG